MKTYLIHHSHMRETPWAITEKGNSGSIKFATHVFIDVQCQTFEDYHTTQRAWCYIEAQGCLTWTGTIARIEGSKDD